MRWVVVVALGSVLCACRGSGDVCIASAECGHGFRCVFEDNAHEGTCEPYDDTEPPDWGRPGSVVYEHDELDILFVVDNSGTAGRLQARLAAAVPALMEELEARGASYRIGVTTTDAGNPQCGGTTPEDGALVASSCLERLEAFDPGMPFEPATTVCTDHCALDGLELVPTTTEDDPTPKVRPWLERIDGHTNLPNGVDPAQALACMLPQGIDGCGFEAPLESMYRALLRSASAEEPSYGFHRRGAPLAVVFVTNAVDCSPNPAWDDIFSVDGDRTFWTDPEADLPTSGVCWNAGVACDGGPGLYDDCRAVNRAVSGEEVEGDADEIAVLHPVRRYVDLLEGIRRQVQEVFPSGGVRVFALTGVPEGWPDDPIVYADAEDPQVQIDYGIGPGCEDTEGLALPPVRLREIAGVFDDYEPSLFSACAADYGDALGSIGRALAYYVRPPCVPFCVHDMDPSTSRLDPECAVTQSTFGEDGLDKHDVAPCRLTCGGDTCDDPDMADGWEFPDASVDVCYVLLADDEEASPTTLDDLPAGCGVEGWNLGLAIERREPMPGYGEIIRIDCHHSKDKETDCPGLG